MREKIRVTSLRAILHWNSRRGSNNFDAILMQTMCVCPSKPIFGTGFVLEKLSFSVCCCCYCCLLLPVLIKKSIFRLANAFQNNGLLCANFLLIFYFRSGKSRSLQNSTADHFIAFIFFSMYFLLFIKLVLFKVFVFFYHFC